MFGKIILDNIKEALLYDSIWFLETEEREKDVLCPIKRIISLVKGGKWEKDLGGLDLSEGGIL